jgi:hypothetical protein
MQFDTKIAVVLLDDLPVWQGAEAVDKIVDRLRFHP